MTEHKEPKNFREHAERLENESNSGVGNAKDELFEAIDHLKSAATLLFDRASNDATLEKARQRASDLIEKGVNDPAIGRAQKEVDEMVRKIASSAEPMAQKITDEFGSLATQLGSLTKRLREAAKDKSSHSPRADSSKETE